MRFNYYTSEGVDEATAACALFSIIELNRAPKPSIAGYSWKSSTELGPPGGGPRPKWGGLWAEGCIIEVGCCGGLGDLVLGQARPSRLLLGWGPGPGPGLPRPGPE